jgi:tRNA (mo5U34)-methyltransferase
LTTKGQLVLETIILDGPSNMVLSVPDRYCMMRNVYWIPTESALITWFRRSGFKTVDIIAKDEVTNKEQSKTDYAPFFSLDEFSNQKDPSLTIEGFPGPIRISLIAK